MKPSIDLRELLGWIAVVGMLVLASPGVTIVHAESEEQASRAIPAPAPACQAGAETSQPIRQAVSVDLTGLVALQGPGSGADVVALETGGYGYGEDPAAGLEDASAPSAAVPTD